MRLNIYIYIYIYIYIMFIAYIDLYEVFVLCGGRKMSEDLRQPN
jgi:hypothetical protein